MTNRTDPARRAALQQKLAAILDEQALSEQLSALAKSARVSPTQINQIEQVSISARAYTEVFNLIMRQIGKHEDWEGWGSELLNELKGLAKQGQTLIEGDDDWDTRMARQQASLALVRGGVRIFAGFHAFHRGDDHDED
jgi:hypothetical protein